MGHLIEDGLALGEVGIGGGQVERVRLAVVRDHSPHPVPHLVAASAGVFEFGARAAGHFGAICDTERSAGSSSQAPSTVDLSMTSDANMAWLLAIAADVCLTGHERTMTFVELGCGENNLAIERILNAVRSSRMALPVAIFDRLTRWLDGYVGSPEEPRLRTMLAEIRAQQFQPDPFRTQQAQRDVRRTATSACSVSVARRRHV